MTLTRREIVLAALAGAAAPLIGAATRPAASEGVQPAPAVDQAAAAALLSGLPADHPLHVMAALAATGTTPLAANGLPFGRRWPDRSNPLLARIWRDMGYPYQADCTGWSGVTLGWCLKRAGLPVPVDCSNSRTYLRYGTPVAEPQPGDICVFTATADPSHGHVTLFEKALPASGSVQVLGADQSFADPSGCPADLTGAVVDSRPMLLRAPTHYLAAYVRPPLRS